MIKAKFFKESCDGFGIGFGLEFARVKVPHPFTKVVKKQPTFTMVFRIWNVNLYVVVFREVKHVFNRQQRRASKNIIKFN